MEYEKIKEWLESLILTTNARLNLVNFNSEIKSIAIDYCVHIYKGIDIIADVMGLSLSIEQRDDNPLFPYRYSFIYKGMEFFQITDEELPQFGGKEDAVSD